MSDQTAVYGPDILLALVSTATFGGWGLAGAAVVSLARHSSVVQVGIAQLAPQIQEAQRRLPDLLTATLADRALVRRKQEPITPQAHASVPAATTQQERRPRWLEVVNDDPDRTPHTLIIGGSGVGKTTLATAIAADRGGRVIVLSPKVAAGNWRGAEVITLDDDGTYAPIGATLADLEDEKRRRIVALRRHGPDVLEPMTVVLDELQQLTAHAPASGEFMVGMSSIGREIKMRMIVSGTTDDALNIRGWKASRGNYVRIDLDRNRRATISDGTRTMTVQAQESKRIADAARLAPWRQAAEGTRPPRPVEPMNGRKPHPDFLDYPRRDTGSCANDAIAQLIGRDPGIPSWIDGGEFPALAQRLGLEYAEGPKANPWLYSGEPVAICFQTDEGDGHLEYTRAPMLLLRQLGMPAVLGVFRNPTKKSAVDLDFLLDGLLADVPPAAQQSVTVDGGAGHTTVNVWPAQTTVVPVPVEDKLATVARATKHRGVNIRAMRERAARYQQVRALVAEDRSGNEIDRIVPGERKKILRLVRQAKAELGR